MSTHHTEKTFEPVSPLDVVAGSRRVRSTAFAQDFDEKEPQVMTRTARTDSSSSSESFNSTRKPRFIENTSVISPAMPNQQQSHFSVLKGDVHKPSDVGFGYLSDTKAQEVTYDPNRLNPGGFPLKSALKTPGTASRLINPLSPTFQEEETLEKREEATEKEQAKDLIIKTRVRLAKIVLRGVNFSCSLIVLSMLSTTLTIFHATKDLPSRNNLSAWGSGGIWPQVTVLVISCISLALSVVVMAAYCRGQRKRAQKTAVYYTMFSIGYFIFATVMWLIGAGVLHGSQSSGNGQDIWGWSCKDNKRKQLFQNDVHYALVCRLQDWSLVCCIIEVVVEVIVIAIYSIVFYRFYSKNRLRKSMNARDRARTDLYLAQLRSQSAPNTPGFANTPRSLSFPVMSKVDNYSAAENGQSPTPKSATTASPFKLQPPPIKIHHATPRAPQDGFEIPPPPPMSPPPQERVHDHVEAVAGEQTYDAVPIPGAYQSTGAQPHAY